MTTVRGMASLYEPRRQPIAPFQKFDQSRSQPQVTDRCSVLEGAATFRGIVEKVGGRPCHQLDGK